MSAIIDLRAIVADALGSVAVLDKIADAVGPRVADLVIARLDAQRATALEPLSTILGISKRAAIARLARDPELRACGLRVGRSLRFRRVEVEALLAARQRARLGMAGR